jgi:hypothetical protein
VSRMTRASTMRKGCTSRSFSSTGSVIQYA